MADESKAIAVRQGEPLIPNITDILNLSQAFHKSGMWPTLKSADQILAVVELGRELGIPAAAALNTIVIISGRITMEARTMMAVAHQRAGVTWKVLELNAKGCKMQFSRPGFEPMVVSFTEDDAKAAGLIGKSNWKMYPEDMMFARCSSRGVKRIAGDTILGLAMTKEEAMDIEVELPKAQVVPLDSVEKDTQPEPEPMTKQEDEPGFKPSENEDADPIEEP